MASRLLSRSKTLTLSRLLLLHPSAPGNPVTSAHGLRAFGSLAPHPPPDPRSAAIAPAYRPDRPSAAALGLFRAPVFGQLGFGKNMSHMAGGVEDPNCLKGKEIDSSKVMAFSPLEGTLTRERKSGLTNESLKVKRMELSIKTTYALIPALLLISKSTLTTSALVLCVYWQIYGFFKEILLDYVHHDVTRKWVLIYFKLLLFILAKDTILAFDLV
ncbi:unnamed protein product [Musa acuminata subsp. malaccensis]|uniref:(wild Malaysian banana) hypothetical protein n=1 Tax=Musa acuminata subsp. malaccensis TaxID=214687 RepID=A0A804KMY7_MUSAM|nr:PREDICTED: succinate dehydrogenase subunit 4, mitochondrial-like [Musa acuminata subsp. malaccensis]CAG1836259.1 unnamed protein product [Musa acuminata subsp. malaccensis]